jgi:hypothetical protein
MFHFLSKTHQLYIYFITIWQWNKKKETISHNTEESSEWKLLILNDILQEQTKAPAYKTTKSAAFVPGTSMTFSMPITGEWAALMPTGRDHNRRGCRWRCQEVATESKHFNTKSSWAMMDEERRTAGRNSGNSVKDKTHHDLLICHCLIHQEIPKSYDWYYSGFWGDYQSLFHRCHQIRSSQPLPKLLWSFLPRVTLSGDSGGRPTLICSEWVGNKVSNSKDICSGTTSPLIYVYNFSACYITQPYILHYPGSR